MVLEYEYFNAVEEECVAVFRSCQCPVRPNKAVRLERPAGAPQIDSVPLSKQLLRKINSRGGDMGDAKGASRGRCDGHKGRGWPCVGRVAAHGHAGTGRAGAGPRRSRTAETGRSCSRLPTCPLLRTQKRDRSTFFAAPTTMPLWPNNPIP